MSARPAHVLVGAFALSPFNLALRTFICVELWGCSFLLELTRANLENEQSRELHHRE